MSDGCTITTDGNLSDAITVQTESNKWNLKWRRKMDYIYAAIAIIGLIAIYLVIRKRSNDKRNCGKIACEPIVPVADRDETGVAEGERLVDDDTVKAASDESCDKD